MLRPAKNPVIFAMACVFPNPFVQIVSSNKAEPIVEKVTAARISFPTFQNVSRSNTSSCPRTSGVTNSAANRCVQCRPAEPFMALERQRAEKLQNGSNRQKEDLQCSESSLTLSECLRPVRFVRKRMSRHSQYYFRREVF